ncbi:hypothetical protein [Streptomyces erythrochromogenes]|uniref:hypothetical protein n=1 Tax=Streptomyces erythrochromogenes TaxID=285574 RepID=UPI0036C3816E
MQELRFDDIRFTTAVSGDQTWLRRALGGHELSVQLAVGVSPFAEAGKILALEAELFGFGTAPAQRSRLGRMTANLAYTPVVTVHRVNLVFPLTSLQVHAIEEARTGDVRFEIDLNATLPQDIRGAPRPRSTSPWPRAPGSSRSHSSGRPRPSRWPCPTRWATRSAPRSAGCCGKPSGC